MRVARPPAIPEPPRTSVFKDRYLFGFDGQGCGGLKCVEFDTGKEKEDWDSGREVGKGSLILAGKHLIIQTERGDLCLVEANHEEFRLVAKIPKVLSGKNNWATPTLVDGRLYLRDEEKVVCYDVRVTRVTTSPASLLDERIRVCRAVCRDAAPCAARSPRPDTRSRLPARSVTVPPASVTRTCPAQMSQS